MMRADAEPVDVWVARVTNADICVAADAATHGITNADTRNPARAVARAMLAGLCSAHGGALRYSPTGAPQCVLRPDKKPHRTGDAEPLPMYVNASHDGDCALAAASRHPVGVDVVSWPWPPAGTAEHAFRQSDHARNRQYAAWKRLITGMLSAQEQERYERMEPEHQARCLCDAWAAREAALKYLGIGLTVHPRTLRVVPNAATMPIIATENITVTQTALWRVDAAQLPAINVLTMWSEDARCSMAVASGPMPPLAVSRRWIG